jgi:hypothetical protein
LIGLLPVFSALSGVESESIHCRIADLTRWRDEPGGSGGFWQESEAWQGIPGVTVVQAVKKWRFQPAVANGAPVATKVVLPVKIVDPTLAGSRFIVTE